MNSINTIDRFNLSAAEVFRRVKAGLSTFCALGVTTTLLAPAALAQNQTTYVGNSLTISNGTPGGPPPLVILGEYNAAGPLPSSSPATTLPNGVVANVKFYGQNYNFTLYALARVSAGANPNEQTFRVVASQYFFGSATNASLQVLPVASFVVHAGDVLAFAGIGPYYAPNANDAPNSDATYEDSAHAGYFTATPPGSVGAQFTVGANPDTKGDYEYISDSMGNQGRTYAIGVDVTSAALQIASAPGGTQVNLSGPAGLAYLVEASANLDSPAWLALTNLDGGISGAAAFVDPSATNIPTRFYRSLVFSSPITNGIITTFAGGGPATTNVAAPWGLAVDASGNLFVADEFNNVVRELRTNGALVTVAGNGRTGFSGDGGPATNARLNNPSGRMAMDAAGNFFFCDTGNYRVRKVDTHGIITTIAGNGTYGNTGDGGPALPPASTRLARCWWMLRAIFLLTV